MPTRAGPVPFLHFAELLAGRYPQLDTGVARTITARFAGVVERHTVAGVATVPAAELAAVAQPSDRRAFVSPDILLSGDGSGPIVLGELHPYMFAWGLQGEFNPDPDTLRAEVDDLLDVWGGESSLAIVLHRRRHKGLVSDRFPGTWIEVTGRAGSGRRLAVADLRVGLNGAEPELIAPDGRRLTLYIGEEDQPHLRVFAPPQVELPRVWAGDRAPRIVVGEVVVQRAQWRLDPAELAPDGNRPAPARLVAAVRRLRTRRSLPRHVYVRSDSEIKPMYLDLDSLVALDLLWSLAERGPLVVTEMLPGPDELWLRRSSGALTSEIRLARPGSADPTPLAVDDWLEPLARLAVSAGVAEEASGDEARLWVAASRGLLLDLVTTGERAAVDRAAERLIARYS